MIFTTFVSNIHKYGLQIVYQASVKTRYLWCQLVSRICQLIVVSIHRIRSCAQVNAIDTLNEKMFMCTSWLYSLSQAIAVTRYIHADLNHIITVIFWRTGKFLMSTLDELYPVNIAKIYADSKLANGTVDSLRYNTKMLVLRDTYQLISSKLIHLFTVTSPAPLELPSEVARFFSSRSSQMQSSPSWDNHGVLSLKSSLFLSGARSHKADLLSSSYTQRAMGDAWPSSRLRWMVLGLSSLIRAGGINLLETRVFLAQRQEWVSAIGEAFSYSLSLGPFYEGHIRDRNHSNQSAAILSTYLMNVILQLFYGYDDLRLFDAIFWELDQRLKNYCDCHKRMKRSRSISMKRSETLSAASSAKHQQFMGYSNDSSGGNDEQNTSMSSSNLTGMSPNPLSRSFIANRSVSGKNFEFTPIGISPDKYRNSNHRSSMRENLSTISSAGSRSRGNSLSISVTDDGTSFSRTGKKSSIATKDYNRIRNLSIQEDSDSDQPVYYGTYAEGYASSELSPSPPKRLSVIHKERLEKKKNDGKETPSEPVSAPAEPDKPEKLPPLSPKKITTPKGNDPVRYKVDDKIDGNFLLANGTKRWFPGKILAVHNAPTAKATTYDVKYDDGEIVHNVTLEDIRPTKRRPQARVRNPTAAAAIIASPTNSTQINLEADLRPIPMKLALEKVGSAASESSEIDSGSGRDQAMLSGFRSIATSTVSKSTLKDESIDLQLSSRIASPLKFKPDSTSRLDTGSGKLSQKQSKRDLNASTDEVNKLTARNIAVAVSEMTLTSAIIAVVSSATTPAKSAGAAAADLEDKTSPREKDLDSFSPRSAFSNDSDDNIFTIPSVFDGLAERKPLKRQISNISGSFVPKVQLSQIDHSASTMNMAGGNSLSSALIPESHDLIDAGSEEEDEGGDVLEEDDYADEYHRIGPSEQSWFEGEDLQVDMLHSPGVGGFDESMDETVNPSLPVSIMNSPSTGIAMMASSNSHYPTSNHRHSKSQLKLPTLSGYQGSTESITSRSKGDDSSSFRLTYREDSARLSTNRSVMQPYDALSPPLQQSGIQRASPPIVNSPAPNLTSQLSERGNLSRQKSTSSRSSNEGVSSVRRAGSAVYRNNYPAINSGILSHMDNKDLTTDDSSIDEQASFELWSKPYALIVLALIQRCLIEGLYLDSAVCFQKSNLSITLNQNLSFQVPKSVGRDDRPGLNRSNSTFSIVPQQVNLLFTIREYFEYVPMSMSNSIIQHITEVAGLTNHSSLRMLKLLTPTMFQNCLISHITTNGQKIGDGGFGSVYRVCCPGHSCGRFNIRQKCLNAAGMNTPPITNTRTTPTFRAAGNTPASLLASNATISPKGSTTTSTAPSNRWVPDDCYYAIKRIPRERSIHDQATIFSIFNEVTCLELCSNHAMHGICPLYDFGVNNGEYWLVMELGGCNLSEWRQMLTNESVSLEHIFSSTATGSPKTSTKASATSTPSNRRSSVAGITQPSRPHPMTRNSSTSNISSSASPFIESLNCKNIVHCMLLYIDAIFVLQAVHDRDIAHFDIKCNNFIIRHDQLDFKRMVAAHKQGHASGALFLTDFGEAIPYITRFNERAALGLETTRCRGTLPIQAPEQIAMSDESINANQLSANSSTNSIASMNQMNIPALIGGGNRNRGLSVSSDDRHHTSRSHDENPYERRGLPARPNHISKDSKAPRLKFSSPDKASDVWSLGAMAVELLTGNYLFAERPWPDLFVRCCLEVFPVLPLESYRLSMILIRSASVKLRLEELVKMSMKQHPSQRAPLQSMLKASTVIVKELIDEARIIDSIASPRTPLLSPAPLPKTNVPAAVQAAAADVQSKRHSTVSVLSESPPISPLAAAVGAFSAVGKFGSTGESFVLASHGNSTPDIDSARSTAPVPSIVSIPENSIAVVSENKLEEDVKAASLYSSVMSLPVKAKLRPMLLHLGNALYLHLQPANTSRPATRDFSGAHVVTWDQIINTSHQSEGRRMLNDSSNTDDTSGSLSDDADHLLSLLGPVDLPLDSAGVDMFVKEQREKTLKDLHSSSNCVEFLLTNSSPSLTNPSHLNLKYIDGNGEIVKPSTSPRMPYPSPMQSAATAAASTSYAIQLSAVGLRSMPLSEHDSSENSSSENSSSHQPGGAATSSQHVGSIDVAAVIRQLKTVVRMSESWINGTMPSDGAIIISVTACAQLTTTSNPVSATAAATQSNPVSGLGSDLGSGIGSGLGPSSKMSSLRSIGGDEVDYLASQLTMAVAIVNYLCHHRNGRYQRYIINDINQRIKAATNETNTNTAAGNEYGNGSSAVAASKRSSPGGSRSNLSSSGRNSSSPSRHRLSVTINNLDNSFENSQSHGAPSYAATPTSARFTPKSTRFSKLLGGRPPISPSGKNEVEIKPPVAVKPPVADSKQPAAPVVEEHSTDDDFITVNKIAPHLQRACNQDLYEYLYRSISS
jgi:hypothetical protein